MSTETRREQLIDAAITVLMRDGVHKASVRAIATEAGASLAAVHVCFTNKEELIRGAIDRFVQQNWLAVGHGDDEDANLRQACHRVLDGYWAAITDEPLWSLAQFEVGLWAVRERQHHDLIRLIYNNYETKICQVLSAACARAHESPKIPVEQIARALVAIIDGCNLQFFADPLSSNSRRLAIVMLDSLIDSALPTRFETSASFDRLPDLSSASGSV